MVMMLITFVFIHLAAKLTSIYLDNPSDCPVEVTMIAHAYRFVQYEVDINNPKMIRRFIDFFRETLAKYAVRHTDDDGTFTNCNLGETHDHLDEDNLADSVQFTAFPHCHA